MAREGRRFRWLIVLLSVILVLGLLVVGAGFAFPGLLWMRSLGVTYTQADLDSANAKLGDFGRLLREAGEGDVTVRIGEPIPVSVELTSEELTATGIGGSRQP